MAGTTNRLTLKFKDSAGKTITNSYSPAKPTATAAQVKAAMAAMVARGNIFTSVPAAMHSAELVTTTTTEYDLS